MALIAWCSALFLLFCRKLDIPSYAKLMKLDTRVVLIPCFCILGIWGRSMFISFPKMLCVVLLYDLLVSCNKLQMVQFSHRKFLGLEYIFMFLCFECFFCPDMHKCYHNLCQKILNLPTKAT